MIYQLYNNHMKQQQRYYANIAYFCLPLSAILHFTLVKAEELFEKLQPLSSLYCPNVCFEICREKIIYIPGILWQGINMNDILRETNKKKKRRKIEVAVICPWLAK